MQCEPLFSHKERKRLKLGGSPRKHISYIK